MLDFTKLNAEYTQFWATHNLPGAISNLKDIDYYISNGKMDTFLLPYIDIFKPENLVVYYSIYTKKNKNMSDIVKNHSYSYFISIFADYLKSLIKNITDYQKKIEAENKLSVLQGIFNTFKNVTSSIFSKVILFAIAGFILYIITIKKLT